MMKRLWVFLLLLPLLSACSGGNGYLCLGRGVDVEYSYECDGDLSSMRDVAQIDLENLNTSLGADVHVELTVSSNMGSVEISVISDGETLTTVVHAGEPVTLIGTAFLDTATDSENRRISIVFDPLSEGTYREQANGVHWALVLRAE